MSISYPILEGEATHLEQVYALINELAVFEKEPTAVTNTVEQLKIDFSNQLFKFKVVERENSVIGFALYYFRYSTWKGKCIYLEDFYIQPAFRSLGIGGMLFDAVLQFAKHEGCQLLTWQVLDWNKEAIRFYRDKGAKIDETWFNGSIKIV
jgi:GNAT superfamily N-acetyltransferase